MIAQILLWNLKELAPRKRTREEYFNTISRNSYVSMARYIVVNKTIPLRQAMKIPEARAAMSKAWEAWQKAFAWDGTKVQSTSQVIRQAKIEGKQAPVRDGLGFVSFEKFRIGHGRCLT